jgi:hypothetical protein
LRASYESKVSSLNFQTTQPLVNLAGIDNKPEMKSCLEPGLFLGLSLCLLSGVSLVMMNEPNTKKLFKANAAYGYNAALVLMLAIFFAGVYVSFLHARKAASDGNEKRVDRELS